MSTTEARAAFEDAASRGFPDNNRVALEAALRVIETKTYDDGATATGLAPLPETSPVEPKTPRVPSRRKA